MEPNITIIDESKLRFAGFTCSALGKVSQKTIDFTPWAGKHVRVWLDKDGTYSLDPQKVHFWQVAELDVPEILVRRADPAEPTNDDNSLMSSEVLPLNLEPAIIEKWELPG